MNMTKCTVLAFNLMFCVWMSKLSAQIEVDSTQDVEIKYEFEKVYNEDEFKEFEDFLTKKVTSQYRIEKIKKRINDRRLLQDKKMKMDTSQATKISYVGNPRDLKIISKGKVLSFSKNDFKKVRVVTDYPKYRFECEIMTLQRDDSIKNISLYLDTLALQLKISTRYPIAEIINELQMTFEEITTLPGKKGKPPIPVVTEITVPGQIRISHLYEY